VAVARPALSECRRRCDCTPDHAPFASMCLGECASACERVRSAHRCACGTPMSSVGLMTWISSSTV
jgi:hypothetical protein